ncbi:MAG: DUF3011 domain-containing protein [Deltaproteobacteria bacterium]|nr:DUF3011 domain-containing protein [Deltaproteobacteria bacterium]
MRKIVLTATLAVMMFAPTLVFAQWGAGGRRTIKCESENNRYAYCQTYTTGRVELRQQLSKTPCREYETWGSDGDGSGLWVRNGCRAVFAVKERHWDWGGGSGGSDGGDWDGGERTFTCKSKQFGYNHCPVPGGRARRIKLERQLSDASCVRGSSWGEDRHGVWVDHGCEAEFKARR